MSSLTRIQCAVDFSVASLAAFQYALALAKRESAELNLVFAIPLDARSNPPARERINLLAEFRRLASSEGVTVSVSMQQGDPADVILLHARGRKPDALVVGTHGRGGMERLRFGSVAARVIQGAPCPTFVVRALPADRGERLRFGRLDRILCATDLTAASSAALHHAIDLVRRGERLTLLHVLRRHRILHPRRPWNFVHTDEWPRIHQIVPPLSPELSGKVRLQLSEGSVAKEIIRAAAETRADLIVVGSRARRGVSRSFGSTTVRILRTSRVPVLVVPELARTRTSEGASIESPELRVNDDSSPGMLAQSAASSSPWLSSNK